MSLLHPLLHLHHLRSKKRRRKTFCKRIVLWVDEVVRVGGLERLNGGWGPC
jgi:hypothetical protein